VEASLDRDRRRPRRAARGRVVRRACLRQRAVVRGHVERPGRHLPRDPGEGARGAPLPRRGDVGPPLGELRAARAVGWDPERDHPDELRGRAGDREPDPRRPRRGGWRMNAILRWRTQLGLTVGAIVLSVGAYVLVTLGLTGQTPRGVAGFVALIAIAYL